jgi:hypothetical protein
MISVIQLMISLILFLISLNRISDIFVISQIRINDMYISEIRITDMYISLIPEFRICTYQKLNL